MALLIFFYAHFFKKTFGIGVSISKPLFQIFPSKECTSHSIILCRRHSRCPRFLSCLFLERKLWNRGFGTKTPIAQLSFFKKLLLHQCYVEAIAAALLIFHGSFFKESCGIGVSVPQPLFPTSFEKPTSSLAILCRCYSRCPDFFVCLSLEFFL